MSNHVTTEDLTTEYLHPSVTLPFPTLKPATPSQSSLPPTIVLISLYTIIFIWVYLQLICILYYRHKRYSYQTALLFLSLLYSMLRISLFSFYFQNAKDANQLIFVLYFALYCLPIFLQFCSLALLVSYYGKVYYKITSRNLLEKKQSCMLRVAIVTSVFVFFLSNLGSAYYTRELCTFGHNNNSCNLFETTLIRVIINDLLFVILGFSLSYYVFKLARLTKLYSIPEQHNISICKALLISVFTSFFLITRTVYNILAITINYLPDFGFDWINVSDQADLVSLTDSGKFMTFALVIFVWEIIPLLVVIFLFRLKRAKNRYVYLNRQSISSSLQKSVFLDTEPKLPNFDDFVQSQYSQAEASINNDSYLENESIYKSRYERTSPDLIITYGSI